MSHNLSTPVIKLNGIGKSRAEKLEKLGIKTFRDLIYYFPRAYENRGDVRTLGMHDTENPHSYILTVASEVHSALVKKGMTISKFRAFDESGSCDVVFFNSPFVKDVFHIGSTFRFFGKASFSKTRRLVLTAPKYEAVVAGVDLDEFTPIYSLTDGISSKVLEKYIKTAVEDILPLIKDPIPEDIRLQYSLPTLSYAIRNIHFPKDCDAIARASRRLAFDEMLYFALGISITANKRELVEGVRFNKCSLEPFVSLLPYELTSAQKNAINDIYRDTVLKHVDGKTPAMSRILIGDVGSGKTVCAAAAAYIAFSSGYQSAIMVPTEILAHQHYEDLSKLLGALGMKVRLLTGTTTASVKKKVYEEIAAGDIDTMVGTHALLSDKVIFEKLGLVITDEQHRFGVAQRALLKEKQKNAHMLVMSATPIPRTLALALYGDLDISKLDELPKGRQTVDTYVVDEEYRTRLNQFISKQVSLGGQCYVVCPAIEKNENSKNEYVINNGFITNDTSNIKNVVDFTDELKKALPELRISSLHGKMKSSEKDATISSFVSGELDVLVSTTVIEVGVNVPNASLMIVENAERFGLSQLHQLRGRVGRGSRKSYCILVSDSKYEVAKERLNVMKSTNDGFEIADKDLLLRGPGDFFTSKRDNNLRQSGGFEFKMASVNNDGDLLNSAFSAAKEILKCDPELNMAHHVLLREEISSFIYNTSTIS